MGTENLGTARVRDRDRTEIINRTITCRSTGVHMTSPVIGTPWKKLNAPVSEEALEGVDKYWRVANYLSIGQIYLRSNPLMKEPFTREDVKHRLVGHWGTTPGLNFLIGHMRASVQPDTA